VLPHEHREVREIREKDWLPDLLDLPVKAVWIGKTSESWLRFADGLFPGV